MGITGDLYNSFEKSKFTHIEKKVGKRLSKIYQMEKPHKLKCQKCDKELVSFVNCIGSIEIKCYSCGTLNGYNFKKTETFFNTKVKKEKYIFNKSKIKNSHLLFCEKCNKLVLKYKLYKGKIEAKCNHCGAKQGVKIKNKDGKLINYRYLIRG